MTEVFVVLDIAGLDDSWHARCEPPRRPGGSSNGPLSMWPGEAQPTSSGRPTSIWSASERRCSDEDCRVHAGVEGSRSGACPRSFRHVVAISVVAGSHLAGTASVSEHSSGDVPNRYHARVTSLPDGLTLTGYDAAGAADHIDVLCTVYRDAYGDVPGEDPDAKVNAFRNRAARALNARNYGLVVASAARGPVIGFVFGYSLNPDRGWWDGLDPLPEPGFTDERDGCRTVVLAEIEVAREFQHHGVGRALHDHFLATRGEERAALCTGPDNTAAVDLYQSWGWHRVGSVPESPEAYYRTYVCMVKPLR
jgi:ribosomal protein S18 acetylase RimI-like enzyme